MNLSEIMRPMSLDEVIGNEHIVKPLRKQLETNTLSQTLMFTGQFGSGKTTFAKIIASHLGAEVREIDCGSDGSVDRMREVVDSSHLSSLFNTSKVFILDEVHGLSKIAQSALLKTLEEPKENVYYILLTTDVKKLLPTIRSRCVIYETKPAGNKEIGVAVQRVLDKCGVEVENKKDFWSVIEQSEGSLRQVYSLLEKLVAAADNGFISSDVFHAVIGAPGVAEIDENLPLAYIKKDIPTIIDAVKALRKNAAATPVGTAIGLYNYVRAVYLRNPSPANTKLLEDLSWLLTHKQVEWEHFEWLAWRHLT